MEEILESNPLYLETVALGVKHKEKWFLDKIVSRLSSAAGDKRNVWDNWGKERLIIMEMNLSGI